MHSRTHCGPNRRIGSLGSLASIVALVALTTSGCTMSKEGAVASPTTHTPVVSTSATVPTIPTSPVTVTAIATVTQTRTATVTERVTETVTAKVTPPASTPTVQPTPSTTAQAPAEPADLRDDVASWQIRPGGIGPIIVGMRAADLEPLGWVEEVDPDYNCGAQWRETDRLSSLGIYLEMRVGDPDDVDEVVVPETVRTQEGLGIGALESELVDAYGANLFALEMDTNAGPMNSWVTFSPEGALTFLMDAGGRVESVFATRGSDLQSYQQSSTEC